MKETNWKKISNSLVKMHKELGGALVNREGENAVVNNRSLVNTSKEDEILTLVGKKLSPKRVRKFMWDNRNSRRLTRSNAIVWSWYNEDEDKTYMGFGASVEPKKVDRGLIHPSRIVNHGN